MLTLESLKVMAQTAADLTSVAREASEQARDYYDGWQLTRDEVAELKRRKQPIIINNRIRRKVDAMVGIEQRSRTDPRALPRNPRMEQAADIATKALVYVDDTTRFDSKRSAAFENLLVEGYGGAEIVVEQRQGKYEIVVNRLRWEEIFFDPSSREKDFSDAAFVGCMKWMSLDAAIAMYGEEHEEKLTQTVLGLDGETFEDRPLYENAFRWGDKNQRRVRVAQMYYRHKNTWHLAIFTGGGEISNTVSPYYDDMGEACCPMVLMSGYVDRENRRSGVVRDMLSAQDEVNKRRSKSLHMLNSRQTQTVKGAVDPDRLKLELAKPDGNVELDIDSVMGAREAGVPAFQILNNNDQLAGHFQLLVEAKNEIDMLGPNASLLGQLQGDQSGRAIMAQQQAGLVELSPIYDSLRDWTLRCYRQMWMRIKQYWTEERWVRITDEVQAPQFIGLNVTQGYDPMTMQPIVQNPVAQMDVDIIIDEAPDVVTLRQEEFEQLAQLAQQGIPIPPEMLIEASSVRNKQRLLETMKAQQEAAMQAQMAGQQAQAAAMQAETQAKVITAQAKAELDMARAQKTMAETPGAAAKSTDAQIQAAAKTVIARQVGL